MKVNIEKKSETKREVEVTIPASEMGEYLDKTAKKLSEEMNIKGFRPGNAPRDIVENTAGKEKLWEEAAKEAIQSTYPQVIEENDLFAVSQPQVELVKCAPENDIIYKATVYVMPEIELPDYKKIAQETIEKEKSDTEVQDKEVEETMERIRESRAKVQAVDRGAEKGDEVTINFKGSFPEKEDKKIEEKDFKINLGKGELNLLQGFEDNLYGLKEGEKKEFSLNMPDSESNQELSGKSVNFEVEVVSVKEKILPEINDEFAASLPDIDNLEQLKEKIREGIRSDKENKEKERLRAAALENIKKETSFEIPEVLVEKELDNIMNNLRHQLKNSGVEFDDYLKEIGKSEEDVREDSRKKAEDNVAHALILYAIGKKENIEVGEEEIEEEMNKHFQAMGRSREEEKEENLQRMRAYIHDVLKNQKVLEALSL